MIAAYRVSIAAVLLLQPLCIIAPALGASQNEVVDALGRKVEVVTPVRRIVALNSDAVEVLRILNVQDLIVGVFSQIDADPQFWGDLVNRRKVGSWREPNSEVIVELEPDIVLAYAKTPSPEWEARMAARGIRVLRFELYRIDSLEREVRELGRVLDRKEEAERFCSWHDLWLRRIREKVASVVPRPSVYVESYGDYVSAGPTTGGDQMCVDAGGRNISDVMAIPFPRVTPEWVVAQDPDVVVKAAVSNAKYGAAESGAALNRVRDRIMQRPAWNLIKAVSSGRVHVLDSSIWVGPRAIIGLAYMIQWLHPGLMADLSPEALHKEYLETFQKLPYKGVFVSDPVAGSDGKCP
ncbi:MAG TPA: ABC transporter substrate-binding protein [Syntrophobacteraceae bacterium]|nr:ABC transporter substrate-binding protein [Syntrophobacteraceae bacterium]